MKNVFFLGFFVPLILVAANKYNTEESVSSLRKGVKDKVTNYQAPIEWKELLDPTKDSFWKEGNHTPDAGFLLFAKNPTKENAKLWLIRNEMKAHYLELMLSKVKEAEAELIRENVIKDRYQKYSNRSLKEVSKVESERNKIIYFFYNPKCSYCQKMAEVLKNFSNVFPLQVGNDPIASFNGLPESKKASQESIGQYLPDGQLPTLVLYDHENKIAKILKGFRTKDQIISELNSLRKK